MAFGWASNAVGTINPVGELVRRAHEAGALTYVDAVHAAPHLPIDVQAIGTDFLACSAYKFFGPHVGVLYGRAGSSTPARVQAAAGNAPRLVKTRFIQAYRGTPMAATARINITRALAVGGGGGGKVVLAVAPLACLCMLDEPGFDQRDALPAGACTPAGVEHLPWPYSTPTCGPKNL